MKVCIRVMMNGCICVKQMLLKACVYTDANTERRENHKQRDEEERDKRQKITTGREKKDKLVSVRSFGGQLRGSSSPPRPLPGPSQKPPGVPWFLRKNISAPITPEPGAGLFTLAWPPDSFTDVTYRHTGTLSQRGSRNTRREEEEESRIDEEWRSEADE